MVDALLNLIWQYESKGNYVNFTGCSCQSGR